MKKIFKRSIIALIALMIVGAALVFGINAYVVHSVKDRILTPAQAAGADADCVIVLGAGIWGDRPSPILRDRLDYGIALYEAGAGKKLLMSGDHGRIEHDEVNLMKDYATERGVPSEDVFMDHAGFSTYESMYRAAEVFEAEKVIIVTQEYHLYRALYDARRMGIEAYGVASDPYIYAGQWYRDLREILARDKDFIKCLFKPKPKYLGEAIPVSGDGNLTNDR